MLIKKVTINERKGSLLFRVISHGDNLVKSIVNVLTLQVQ